MSSGGISLDDINLSETVCPHHVWHIRDFEETIYSGITGKWEYSPRFHTFEGYSFQVVLIFESDEVIAGFRLVSGNYDYYLEWPCPHRQITLQLVAQTGSILQRVSQSFSTTISPTDMSYTGESWHSYKQCWVEN